MAHLFIDLAKIGLIVITAGIAVSAFISTAGTSYDPWPDEFYTPVPTDDEDGE